MIAPPKEIAPFAALVLIVLVPAKTSVVGTAFEIVKELAVTFPETAPPIEMEPVPTSDEMSTAPSGVVPPTAPVNVITPVAPAFNVNACDPVVVPSTVEEKLIFAPTPVRPALFNVVVLARRDVIPVNPMVPAFVVILPLRLRAVVLALVLVAEKLPSAVFEPMFAERVIVPDPDAKVRPADPIVAASIVLLKVIFWPVFVIVGVVPVKTTGSGNV